MIAGKFHRNFTEPGVLPSTEPSQDWASYLPREGAQRPAAAVVVTTPASRALRIPKASCGRGASLCRDVFLHLALPGRTAPSPPPGCIDAERRDGRVIEEDCLVASFAHRGLADSLRDQLEEGIVRGNAGIGQEHGPAPRR